MLLTRERWLPSIANPRLRLDPEDDKFQPRFVPISPAIVGDAEAL